MATVKVACLGAGGGIGQPLYLLLRTNPNVSQLSLYDIRGAHGVATELNHIPSNNSVQGYDGAEHLPTCLQDATIVVICAGFPGKPGLTRADLVGKNGGIKETWVSACAQHCPDAWICIVTNPVNQLVPLAAKTLDSFGKYNPKKLFGVTTLDLVRAQRFANSDKLVPVVGGHSGTTICPLFSKVGILEKDAIALTKRVQNAGTEVVEAKQGNGSATLSMAYAANRFVDSCVKALLGTELEEYAYVQNNNDVFWATKLLLDSNGIKEIHHFKDLSKFEEQIVADAKSELLS